MITATKTNLTTSPTTPVAGKIGDDEQTARNRTHQHFQDYFTGNGSKTRFALAHTPRDTTQMAVYVSGLRKLPKLLAAANDFSLDGSVLVFAAAPANLAPILVDTVI